MPTAPMPPALPARATPQGKARSAQNSRKHSFTPSTFAVVRLEDLRDIAHLKDDLAVFAIERIALAQQALLIMHVSQ